MTPFSVLAHAQEQTLAMADHLVSIYGTEKDRINCPFYYKIGACRHGDRCSRVHNKPLLSPTILIHNLYQSTDQILASAAAQGLPPPQIPKEDIKNHFEDFYEDVYQELSKHGTIENLYVCENLADHLAGNTYVKFQSDTAAKSALEAIASRFYAGRVVKAEFSPVTDFREGKCRPFEKQGMCEHGDYCHFMHLRRQPLASMVSSAAPQRAVRDDPERYRSRDRDSRRDDRDTRRDDRYHDDSRYSSRDNRQRSREGKHSWLDGDQKRERSRDWDRDRRDSQYDRGGSRERYPDGRRDRYSDYSRSRRSRDRRDSR